MKKINIKNKILKIFSLTALSVVVAFSVIFAGISESTKKSNNAFAASYANAETYVAECHNDISTIPASYYMLDEYPIHVENQLSTDLCWVYASQKAMETCLMVETGMYYDFSETATAIFAYKDGLSATIKTSGNFEKFNIITQKYGIVSEADFSNDNLYDVTEENVNNYSYIFDRASHNISSTVLPVNFSSSETYRDATSAQRSNVLKRFILNHGGLFIGLEPGTIKPGINGLEYVNEVDKNVDGGKYFELSHAVTIVGYNADGFIALNSWGIETESYQKFIIPYEYASYTDVVYGYVYSESSDIELQTTSASNFSQNIVSNLSNPLKNMFTYGETVSLTYKLSDAIDFEGVYVNVYKNEQELTNKFTIFYDDTNKTISLDLVADSSFYAGGTYVIRIYEDMNLAGVETFSIYTSTEVAYFKMFKDNASKSLDSYALLSSNETSENVMTFYLSAHEQKSYHLNFYLTNVNKVNGSTGPTCILNNVYVYENGSDTATSDSSFKPTYDPDPYSNRYTYKFNNLSNYAGKRIQFSINIYRTNNTLTSPRRTYIVNIFVSDYGTTQSSMANSIEYMLDGGLNSQDNPTSYPNYSLETNMTGIKLQDPTRDGYTFMGWYADPKFETQEVEYINSINVGDVVLYARWEKNEANYFDTSISLSSHKSYDGTPKASGAKIIYGDSLKITYTFTQKELLNGYNYSLKYYYYLNGTEVENVQLQSKTQTVDFSLGFPDLDCGEYEVKIVTVVVVTHQFSTIEEVVYSFEVEKKMIEVSVDNTQSIYTYDGTNHHVLSKLVCDSGKSHIKGEDAGNSSKTPSLFLEGVYAEDHEAFVYELSLDSKKEFGSYKYHVVSINNPNYTFNEGVEGVLVIEKKLLTVSWSNKVVEYNGTEQSIVYELDGIVTGDNVVLEVSGGSKTNAGVYTAEIVGLSNPNYKIDLTETASFEITKAPITISFESITERIQTAPAHRKQVQYEIVSGMIYGEDELNIKVICDGLNSKKSGTYEIKGEAQNPNYHVVVQNGEYILTGYYYVYYTLPNGEIYTELVADGKDPKGINDKIYKLPALSGYKYSQDLKNVGKDLYITVEVVNYTWWLIGGVLVVLFVGIYVVATRKARKNKTI